MIDSQLESRAESTGYMCREVGDARDSNPFLQHLGVSPALAQELADAWWHGWDRADGVDDPSVRNPSETSGSAWRSSAPQGFDRGTRAIPTEFWLWFVTDDYGQRRMTTYRMSRQVALGRYSDARKVPGTVEIRNLPDSRDEKPAGLERRKPNERLNVDR